MYIDIDLDSSLLEPWEAIEYRVSLLTCPWQAQSVMLQSTLLEDRIQYPTLWLFIVNLLEIDMKCN